MNKAYYKKAKRATPKAHDEAVAMLKEMFALLQITTTEGTTFTFNTKAGKRTYEPDLLCLTDTGKYFIVEVDGKSHDDSGQYQSRKWKDAIRDEAFKSGGIPTVRFEVDEIVGEHRLDFAQIYTRIYDEVLQS